MKLLVFGGTGRTGKHIISQGLARGHEVLAIMRHTDQLKAHELLSKIQGNAGEGINSDDRYRKIDVVLSALNISRTTDFPWSPLRTPKTFLKDSLGNILQLMHDYQIKRLIVTSAWGVGNTSKMVPAWFRWIVKNSNVKYPYLGHEEQEMIIRDSRLEWTMVRPVGLTNGPHKKITISTDPEQRMGLTISRRDVAKFMLDIAEQHLYIREFPSISH